MAELGVRCFHYKYLPINLSETQLRTIFTNIFLSMQWVIAPGVCDNNKLLYIFKCPVEKRMSHNKMLSYYNIKSGI